MIIRLKKQVINILKVLKKKPSEVIATDLAKELKIDYIVLMSAINDLIEHDLGYFKEEEVYQISLNDEGIDYLNNGLPERQLLNILLENNIKELSLDDFLERSHLDRNIFYVGISNLKKKRWIAQSKASGENKVFITAEKFPKTVLERFLQKFKENPTLERSLLSKDELVQLDLLNKRKLVKKNNRTERIINLTEKGKKIDISKIKELEQVSKITSEMLSSGSWKNYDLKPFDVTKPGPLLKAGKLHPMIKLINEIREIFISMGFTEIRGPIIESAFYNFDALFQPQDHPAREMQDTFYLSNPEVAKLPEQDRVKAVQETHENGGDSGSRGWGYDWEIDTAKKTVLRTHTTSTTIRRLAKFYRNNEKPPVKVFCIDRVFRNEKLDKSHLAEFTQVEGIVIDDNVTLCDLIGLLSEFYRKLGFKKIITRPGFFPYTEPSMEVSVYYDKLGEWLEMGGSGIFRPEVTYPWGIKDPTRVLAWGQGLERIAMLYFDRDDIRDLYINPIKWLRSQPY
ncbi:MAG: phenylalanine--tRNA ligase subunit alpha [Promethearchaeota archaeon Loki_b32]|nr:MAG: phenylalanine--tRNA ligase subunit alpha [Candidatus Lokiarchaeota archaeon Loki_b32]